jgi:ADP-heptose synthase, bifunctional sugar kinase/adenylyltransferase
VRPEVLVKGGDWRPEQIVGAPFVLENGGQVLSLPFVEGYSTTNIEQKILGRR